MRYPSKRCRRGEMMKQRGLLLACLSVVGAQVVDLADGRVRGELDDGCVSFYGIPYARPPTGDRRWRPPSHPDPWEGVRDATQDVHPECMQLPDYGALNAPAWVEEVEEWWWPMNMDEDCLTVNVHTPSLPFTNNPNATVDGNGTGNVSGGGSGTGGGLPVLVTIYGGSFLSGKGGVGRARHRAEDSSLICTQDVIHVTFNYRLGVFGGLSLPGLLAESNTTGNYGLQDQRMALNWVQKNIAIFGGDPNRVTMSGESAGAMSVIAHSALHRSRGLFQSMIAMSGNDDSLPLSEAISAGTRYAQWVGCGGPNRSTSHAQEGTGVQEEAASTLSCLRAIPALTILNHQTRVYNQSMRALQAPIADGYELGIGTKLRDLFVSGKSISNNTPIIVGYNNDDISLFLGLTLKEMIPRLVSSTTVTVADFNHSMRRFLPSATHPDIEEVWRLYAPEIVNGSARQALFRLGTDGYFACPSRRVLQSHDRSYAYRFDAVLADTTAALGLDEKYRGVIDSLVRPWLGAFHGANEVVFWRSGDDRLRTDEIELGSRMVERWISLIKSGKATDAWKKMGSQSEDWLVMDKTGDKMIKDTGLAKRCQVLDRFDFIWNPLVNLCPLC